MLKSNKLISILGSAIAGVLLAIMIKLNASLGQYIGVLESSFVAHVVGTLFGFILICYCIKGEFIKNISESPKYLLLGGVFGVVVVMLSNIVVPHLGMALTISIFVTTTLVFCTVADHFGFFKLPQFRITLRRSLGLLLAFVGLLLIIWK